MSNQKGHAITGAAEKRALVPKLRFPEFQEAANWNIERLGNLCKIRTGKKDANEGAVNGVYPFFTCAEKHIYSHSYSFDTEALLIAGNANVGQTRYYKGKFEAYQRTYVLTDFSEISVPYLHAVLSAKLRDSLLSQVQVSAMSYIKLPMLQEYGLAVPSSYAEQQKIADCLSSLDELIAAQARKVDSLKTHKKGLMQQLFPREGETQPRLRFPEFQDAGEWKKMTLGTAANFYNGRAYKQEELLETGKYKVLRVGNFFTNNNWYHSNLELDETKYCEDGDLLYAWSASFGPHVWRGEKTIYHYHIWKVVEQPGIDKKFLFIILEHETERMKAKTTNGLGIMHITKGAIEGWASFFPGLAEQRKIADQLMNLDGAIGAEARKLELLTEHKKALMQQIFPSIDEIKI